MGYVKRPTDVLCVVDHPQLQELGDELGQEAFCWHEFSAYRRFLVFKLLEVGRVMNLMHLVHSKHPPTSLFRFVWARLRAAVNSSNLKDNATSATLLPWGIKTANWA